MFIPHNDDDHYDDDYIKDEGDDMSAFIPSPCTLSSLSTHRRHGFHNRKNNKNRRYGQHAINATATKVIITETTPTPWITFPWTPSRKPYTLTYNLPITTTTTKTTTATAPTPITTIPIATPSPTGNVVINKLLQPLLPTRYPENYTTWAKWHISRHIFRNAHYTLGTTSLLVSLGLDRTTSTIALSSSALKWVLKDGIAMLTKLLISTNFANRVDTQSKKFRIIGDCLMCSKSFIEIISLLNPKYFLIYGSLSALCKDAGGAMSGPPYRVFLDSFSKGLDNIGDISAKGEAQVVIGNLIGLGIGVLLSGLLIDNGIGDRLGVWGILSIGHLYSTWNAVNGVELFTWNESRLEYIIKYYEQFNDIPDISDVNKEEFQFNGSNHTLNNIVIGASIKEFWNDSVCVYENIAISIHGSKIGITICDEDSNVSTKDVIRGILQARRYWKLFGSDIDRKQNKNSKNEKELMKECELWSSNEIDRFMQLAQNKRWATDNKLLVGGEFRYTITRVT